MHAPKITVVTPNFNQGCFLEETILSVLEQGYPNLEFIVIDGGSTDGSTDIIRKYEKKLAYWVSEPDNGQYHAVQKGFEKSTGEIMTYLNSDDILAKGSLFTAAQIFNDYPQVKWLGGLANHIDESSRIVRVNDKTSWNRYRYLNLDFEFIQQEGVFWRRTLWNQAGGYISTKFSLASDLELWSRFFHCEELYQVPTILASFRIRKVNQKSLENYNAYQGEALEILRMMPREDEEDRHLKKANSWVFKLLRRPRLRLLFNLLGFDKVETMVYRFPPDPSFDRFKQTYVIGER